MAYRVESFEKLTEALNTLPSIGKKSALKLALYLVQEDNFVATKLSNAIEEALSNLRECAKCNAISEDELCPICSDESRDTTKLCIVQSVKDIFVIEESGIYDGLYYVIKSIEILNTNHIKEVAKGVKEIIFAFPPSIASDSMILFIEDKLEGYPIKFSKIAQGVPTGVELENIDLLSLSRAIEDRVAL